MHNAHTATRVHSRTSFAHSRRAHAEEQLGAFPRRPCAVSPSGHWAHQPGLVPAEPSPERGARARASPSLRSRLHLGQPGASDPGLHGRGRTSLCGALRETPWVLRAQAQPDGPRAPVPSPLDWRRPSCPAGQLSPQRKCQAQATPGAPLQRHPCPSAPSPRPVNQASGTHTPLAPGEAKPGSAVPRLQRPRAGSLPVY